MILRKYIPNFITLLNLATGVVGITLVIQGEIFLTIYLVFLAGIFDFLDGFSARILNAYSDLGKSLDSLADIVSFGVLPAIILFHILDNNLSSGIAKHFLPYFAILIPVCSAVRLAIFNNDEEQYSIFKGLPTPANAFLIVSASYIYLSHQTFELWKSLLLVFIALTGCVLMISRIKMISLKISFSNKNQKWITGSLLLVSAILIFWLGITGLFFSILFYIAISIILSLKI